MLDAYHKDVQADIMITLIKKLQCHMHLGALMRHIVMSYSRSEGKCTFERNVCSHFKVFKYHWRE